MRIVIVATDEREPFRLYDQPEPQFHTAVAALLEGFALTPEVEVHVISCVRQPVNTPPKIAPNIFFHTVLVPKIGWMQTFFQGCVRATRKKIREIGPDIVHGQGTERDCGMDAVFSGFPSVITVHGNMRVIARINNVPAFSYNWLAAKLEGFTLPRADGIICITRYTLDLVRPLARKTWVLPNAVDGSFFAVQNQPANPPFGLCVGTVDARKNQNAFIRSLDPLAKEKNFRMCFASETVKGKYGEEFFQLLRERPWCTHLGFLNRAQLKEKLSTASFLALPTREDNCPMVILEAMAAGVPVLASAVGGVPELIEHEVTGLLCDPDQPETFRIATDRLLKDRPFVRQLTDAAKMRALENFHPLVIARRHVEIYREVLAAKGR